MKTILEIKNLKKKHKNVLDRVKAKLKKEKDEKKKAETQKELTKLETEQPKELEKLFYQKVFAKEQDKMLYFFLAQPQQTVLIKVGEKQAEKDFIGYEFSSRKIFQIRQEDIVPNARLSLYQKLVSSNEMAFYRGPITLCKTNISIFYCNILKH